jgi:predicted aldo/keto reductase-like oxidoreductase
VLEKEGIDRMQYRKYGPDGPRVSRLGFGVMRLPQRKADDWGRVHFTKSKALLRAAMEAGVNFFDTHHLYHRGHSEEAIGRALAGWRGPRPIIQTKTPFYRPEPQRYFKRLIEEALEKLGVDCIDYLLFHSMRMEAFRKRGKAFLRLTDWAMTRGYVRHRGFSSHDSPENIRRFIDTGEFAAMVASYNWLDPKQADTIAYAAGRGMGVAIMNPIGGGHLVTDSPQVRRLLPGAKTAAEVALRFVLDTPGVTLALSGMSTPEQLDENVHTASRRSYMTERQRKTMRRRLATMHRAATAICNACGYCMPCPHGVDIPANFLALSRAELFGLTGWAKRHFHRLRRRKDGDASAFACRKCGACLPKCPNRIAIIDQLARTADLLG